MSWLFEFIAGLFGAKTPNRSVTPETVAMIAQFEGFRARAYQDVSGVWTIGYGHTPAEKFQVITAAYAATLLAADIDYAEDAVAALTSDVPTTNNQFGAMVSLAFNIGTHNFAGSTVLKKHRLGDCSGASEAFLLWDKAHVDGELVVVPGLLNRRKVEAAYYLRT